MNTIRREYLGGSEDLTFKEFAENVIQDYEVASEIIGGMITKNNYSQLYNEDQRPEFIERYTIINPIEIDRQMEDTNEDHHY